METEFVLPFPIGEGRSRKDIDEPKGAAQAGKCIGENRPVFRGQNSSHN